MSTAWVGLGRKPSLNFFRLWDTSHLTSEAFMSIVDIVAAKSRLAEIEAERAPLVALIQAAEAYEQVVGKTLFETSNVVARSKPRPEGSGRAAPTLAATERAVAELLEMMGPCSTAMLADILRHKPDLNLNVANVNNVLSARLSNSKKFVGRRGQGWWFRDRPWPVDHNLQMLTPAENAAAQPPGPIWPPGELQ